MRTAIAWGALVVIVGCGGNDLPEINASSDTVCDEIAQVACYNLYHCCSEGEIEDFLGVGEPRTEDQCFSDIHAVCERQIAAFDFSIKNNHVRFDGKTLDACLEALLPQDGACATIASSTPWTAACMESAWQGIVADGGQCDFVYECGKDSFCSASRICTALPTANMSCAARPCASGLFCDPLGLLCQPLLGPGGTCTSSIQCQPGLFCDASAPTRTCTPLHENGERCTGSTTCKSNLCLPGTCADTGTTCFSSANCAGRCADDNSFCTTDSTCAAGTCSGTATTCFSQADCTAPATCVFPVQCIHAACQGDVICAEAHVVVDYCRGALTNLPLIDEPR